MPVFYKQEGGTWKNVDTPQIKQDGQWITPEQVYIKKNGEWKLIWEEFAFIIETTGTSETQTETILQAQICQFEDFGTDETFFFDQELEEPSSVNGVSVDESRKLVALGGRDDTAYVYDNDAAVNRNVSNSISDIGVIKQLDAGTAEINELDFYNGSGLAVAANSLYVYDENFNLVNTFTDASLYTDVAFNQSDGTIAASANASSVYLYTKQGDGTWAFDQQLTNPITGNVTSVSWRESDGSLAVGSDNGDVNVFDNTFNAGSAQLIDQFDGNTSLEFSPSGRLAVSDETELKIYSTGLNLTATRTEANAGPDGDVSWDDEDNLVFASSDNRVYVYRGSDASFDNIKTFDDASRSFVSVSWDGTNEYIVGGASQSNSGKGYIFSTGVRTFFDWSKQGDGLKYRQRASGLRSEEESFETTLDNLDPDQAYEFRSGGYAADGRKVVDKNSLTFTTADLQVVTDPVSNRQSASAVLNGTVSSFDRTSQNASVTFRWGKESQALENVEDVGLVSGQDIPSTFSVQIDNLENGQDYEYRIKSEYGGVTSLGSVRSFKTRNVTAALSGVTDPTDFGERFISSDTESETSTVEFTVIETSGTGSYTIQESDVNISGEDAGDFTVVTSSGSFPISVSKDNPRNIKVEFSPTEDELQVADLEIAHDAANGVNPFNIGLEGTGEVVPELQLEDALIEAVVDGNEDTAEVFIREMGGDYEATITNIFEDSNQPAGTDTSKWSISNLPGDLSSGGTATVPPGEAVSFTVGFDPDTNSAQDYNVIVDYKGSGIRDDTVLNGTIAGNIRGSIKAEFDPQRNGVVEDTSFDFDTVTSDGGTYVRDSSGPNVTTTVPFKIPGDSLGDFQVIELRIVGGDNPSDFTILNAPPEVEDGDPTTSVNVSETNELLFDVEFNPSAQNERNTNIEVVANNVKTSPVSIGLSGTGLQPSEIVTDVSSLSLGTAIVGGNLTGEEADGSVLVSNPSSDETFDISNDSIPSTEFQITNAVAGNTLGPDVTATVEFVPTGGNDNDSVSSDYEISHNAEIGSDPKKVALSGTVQVTSLDYQTADGSALDPTNTGPHFAVIGTVNENNSRDFEISVLSENTVSTEVSISDPTSESPVMGLNSDKQVELVPGGGPLTGTMNYNPNSVSDDGETESLDVSWDNGNESATIQVEGLVDSVIDVQTPDASGTSGDAILDFGEVIADNTKTLTVTAYEEVGNRSFNITSLGSLSSTSGPYSINNPFGASAPVEVSNGSPASSTVEFAPEPSDAGNTLTNTLTFEHDASYAQSNYENSPVTIDLTGQALSSGSIELVEDSTGTVPVTYDAEVGNTTSTLIRITETGGDNQVTVDGFTVTDDAGGSFNLNSGYSNFGTTVSAGSSITEAVVEFAPDSSTGSQPDFIVNGSLEASYSGNGVPSGATETVGLEGEVLRPAKANVSSTINTPISFGNITVGPSQTLTQTENYEIAEDNLKNSYNVNGVSIGGSDPSYFNNVTGGTNNISSGDTVSAGGTLTGQVQLTFDGSSNSGTSNLDANINVDHDAPLEGDLDTGTNSGILQIPVTATVTVANYALTVTPDPYDFGIVSSATTKQFTIKNTGNQTLNNIQVGTFSSGSLSLVSQPSSTTLDPGNTTTFSIEYSPSSSTDTPSETVSVSSDNTNQDLTVSGDGAGDPSLTIIPNTDGSFANGGTKQFEVQNDGNIDITGIDTSIGGTDSGEFAIVNNTNLSNVTISPGSNRVVDVEYTPSTIDSDTASLEASGNEDSATQSLSGQGISEDVSLNIISGNGSFGKVGPSGETRTFTVENPSTSNVDATGVSVSLPSTTKFNLASGISNSNIPPGETRTYDIEYVPTRFNNSVSVTLTVTSDNTNEPTDELSGTGLTESNISVSTTQLGTASSSSTTKTVTDAVTITNDSAATRSTNDIIIENQSGDTGEINILTSQFTSSLAPGSSTSADVEYSPNETADDSITFDVSTGTTETEPSPPTNVSLSGSGVAEDVSINVSPSSISFGNAPPSGESTTVDVTCDSSSTVDATGVTSGVSGDAEFSESGGLSGVTISPGNTRSFDVVYDPNGFNQSDTGTAAVTVTNTANKNISLSGTGETESSISLTGSDFGTVSSQGDTLINSTGLTIENNGTRTADYSISSVTGDTGEFTINEGNQGGVTGTLSNGQSDSYSVTYTPGGTDSDSITITFAVPDEPGDPSVTISGSGVASDVEISIDPPSDNPYSFGQGAGNKTFTVKNTGNTTVDGLNSDDGSLAAPFSVATDFAKSTLTPGETDDITISYDPTDTTTSSDTLNITTNQPAFIDLVLSGDGEPVQASISCNMDNNGDFGTGGGTATFTVTADSTNNVDITGISSSVSGTDFSEATSLSNVALSPGNSTSFDVDYTPSSVDSDTGTASINADNGSCSIPLSGNGQVVDVALNLSLDNNGDFGTGSGTATATVSAPTSNNDAVTNISGSVSGTDFSKATSVGSDSLAPGGSTTFDVDYTPSSVDIDDGSASVSGSNSTGDSVDLSGNGQVVDVALNLSLDNNGDFGTGSGTATATVSAPDTNNDAVTNISGSVSGTDFSKATSVGTTSLAPGGSTTFDVDYSPGDTSNDSGTASVSGSNSTGDSVDLSGDGEPVSATLNLSLANNGDFGTSSGSTTATVSTPSSNNVDITDVSYNVSNDSGSEFSASGSISSTFTPNQSETFTVSYDPGDANSDNGDVSVSGINSGNGLSTLTSEPLSGNGLVAGFIDTVSAPSNISVQKGSSNTATGGSVSFGGETSVSYNLSASGNANITINDVDAEGTDSKSGTVDPTNTSSIGFSVKVTGDSESTNNTVTTEETNSGNSDTFDVDVTTSVDLVISEGLSSTTTTEAFTDTKTGFTATGSFEVTNNGSGSGNVGASASTSGTDSFAIVSDGIGSLSAGASDTVTVDVDVDQNVTQGTTISVTGTISDGDSTSDSFTVKAPALSITSDTLSISDKTAGGSFSGTFGVENTGNATASVTLTGDNDPNVNNFSFTGSNSISASGSETYTVSGDVDSTAGGSNPTVGGTVNSDYTSESVSDSDTFAVNDAASDLFVSSELSMSSADAGNDAIGSLTVTNDGNADETNFTPDTVDITQNSGSVGSPSISADGDGDIPKNGGTETYTVTVPTGSGAGDQTTVDVSVNDPEFSSATSDTFNINNYDLSLEEFSLFFTEVEGSDTNQDTSIQLFNNGSVDYTVSDASPSANVTQGAGTGSIQNFNDEGGTISSGGGSESFTIVSDPDESTLNDGDTVEVTLSVTDNGPIGQNIPDQTDTYTFKASVDDINITSVSLNSTVLDEGESGSGTVNFENNSSGGKTIELSGSSSDTSNVTISASGSKTVSSGGSDSFSFNYSAELGLTGNADLTLSIDTADGTASDSNSGNTVDTNNHQFATQTSLGSSSIELNSSTTASAEVENKGSQATLKSPSTVTGANTSASNIDTTPASVSFDVTGDSETSGDSVGFEITKSSTSDITSTSSLQVLPGFGFSPEGYTIDTAAESGDLSFTASGTINDGETYSLSLSSGAFATLSASEVDSGSVTISDQFTSGGDTVTFTLTRDIDGASGSGSVTAFEDGGGGQL